MEDQIGFSLSHFGVECLTIWWLHFNLMQISFRTLITQIWLFDEKSQLDFRARKYLILRIQAAANFAHD